MNDHKWLVSGYVIHHYRTHTETIYAKLPDGRVYRRRAKHKTPRFNRPNARWFACPEGVPVEAEFIGNYLRPEQIPA